jgi:hypothetical protein
MSATTDRYTCLAHECPVNVTPPEMMCNEHWAMVPAALRTSLSATYRPDVDATAEHLAYVAAAIAEVTHKQRRRQSRTPRAARQPEQLALFDMSGPPGRIRTK